MSTPPFVISGTDCCASVFSARAFVSMQRRQCLSVSSSAGFSTPMAALLTTMSTRSNCFRNSTNASARLVGSLTSACTAIARRPMSRIALQTASASSWLLKYAIATSQPARASLSAVARPMPRAPPVMNAILPERVSVIFRKRARSVWAWRGKINRHVGKCRVRSGAASVAADVRRRARISKPPSPCRRNREMCGGARNQQPCL